MYHSVTDCKIASLSLLHGALRSQSTVDLISTTVSCVFYGMEVDGLVRAVV